MYSLSSIANQPLSQKVNEVKSQQTADDSIEKIEVMGVRKRLKSSGALKDNIAKTELLTDDYIQNTQSANLADAIKNAVGIRVSNECSMCGVKRVMINGMKGEHTNVLIDGVPMHTMLSGFYGMDSVATSGIGSIEIARGAGASLTAPEAIGGTVNMVTQDAQEDGVAIDLATGNDGYRKASFVGSHVSEDDKNHVTLIAQYDNKDQFDGDNNGVNESPMMTNKSATLHFSHDLSYTDNIRFRYSQSSSEVFGGPVIGDTTHSIADALSSVQYGEAEQLFVNNDVRERYIGNAWETTEWIKTDREEFSTQWLHEFNSDLNVTVSAAYVDHQQDSFYEGIDYYADDKMYYLSTRFNYYVSDTHLLTFGLDHRNEEMRSDSQALELLNNYVSDSFDYITTGIYLQDTWTPSDDIEVAAAVRIDKIKADFVDPSKQGVEIDKTLVSPRIDMRYLHNDQITSRLSLGQGYRAPLSFFESDHGILDAGQGYHINVDSPEKSHSINYSLNYDGEKLSSTLSLAHTRVKNLAALTFDEQDTPVLSQLDDTASVTAMDIAVNYQVLEQWALSFIAEQYNYNQTFKESFGIAPIERRISLSSDVDYQGWDIITSATWVASRDLSDYGYEGFNVNDGTGLKSTQADAYVTVDLKIVKAITEQFKFYIGANNLFDFTQVEDRDSPLFFDADGGYDVAYIYGPLRGRTAYAGVSYEF